MDFFIAKQVPKDFNPNQDTKLRFILLPPKYRYQISFYQRSLTDNKLNEEEVTKLCDDIYKATEDFFECKALNTRLIKLGLTFLITFSLVILIAVALSSQELRSELNLEVNQEVALPLTLLAFLLLLLLAILWLHYTLGQKQNRWIIKDSILPILQKKNQQCQEIGLEFVLDETPAVGAYGGITLLLKYKERARNRNNRSQMQLDNSLNSSQFVSNVSHDALIVQQSGRRRQ